MGMVGIENRREGESENSGAGQVSKMGHSEGIGMLSWLYTTGANVHRLKPRQATHGGNGGDWGERLFVVLAAIC